MSNYEPINFTYYDPNDALFRVERNDRESCTVYMCCNKDNCDAYKRKKCVMLNGLYGASCPYGQKNRVEGYTKASRKCGQLINTYKDKYGNVGWNVKPLEFLCRIGDYIFLNLPCWIRSSRYPIRSKDFFVSNEQMIRLEDFTPEFIVELLTYYPEAYMGGVIKDYQNKYIPTFVTQLKKYMPEMYQAVYNIYPKIESLIEKVDYIGKFAKVTTLLPGKIKFSIHVVDWDGTYIRFKGSELTFSEFKDEDIIIIPNDNTYVKVVDNNTVTENTIFRDE